MELTTNQIVIKNLIESLFYQKIKEFNLLEWNFKWTKKLSTYGTCDYKNKTIELSLPIAVSDKEKAIDTLLHELAHALTPDDGHGKVWKAKCLEIGAEPKRLADNVKLDSNLEHLKPNKSNIRKMKYYQLTCPCCTFSIDRHRKTKCEYSCPKCSSSFDEKFKLIWAEKEKFRIYF